jgi:hypothetical protein
MEQKSSYSERRKHPRYDLYLPIHFHIKDSPDDTTPESMKYFQGFTKNFSRGGLLIEALNLSQPQLRSVENLEAFIEGSILIPTHPRPLRFQARPAWSKKEENNMEMIGMYFTDIRRDDAETLLEYAMIVNKKTRASQVIGSMLIYASILFLLIVYFTTSRIIAKQSDTIQKMQSEQKDMREKFRHFFDKK